MTGISAKLADPQYVEGLLQPDIKSAPHVDELLEVVRFTVLAYLAVQKIEKSGQAVRPLRNNGEIVAWYHDGRSGPNICSAVLKSHPDEV